MIFHNNGEYETKEESEEEAMTPLEGASEVKEAKMGRLVVVIKLPLNIQVKEEGEI